VSVTIFVTVDARYLSYGRIILLIILQLLLYELLIHTISKHVHCMYCATVLPDFF